jgi:hypothetical protein
MPQSWREVARIGLGTLFVGGHFSHTIETNTGAVSSSGTSSELL